LALNPFASYDRNNAWASANAAAWMWSVVVVVSGFVSKFWADFSSRAVGAISYRLFKADFLLPLKQ